LCFKGLVLVVVSSVFSTTLATKESAQACFLAAEKLNDNPSVNEPHGDMIEAYNNTCVDTGLCAYDIDPTLLGLANGGFDASDVGQVPTDIPIYVEATLDFGGSFHDDPSLHEFIKACDKAGGHVKCVDGLFTTIGDVSDMLTGTDGGDGINIDIELYGKKFPYCFPPECEGEDLTEVVEDALRDAVLNIPDVQENLVPTTESLIESITFSQMCAISGLHTCDFSVTAVECKYGSNVPSGGYQVGYTLSILLVLFSTLISLC